MVDDVLAGLFVRPCPLLPTSAHDPHGLVGPRGSASARVAAIVAKSTAMKQGAHVSHVVLRSHPRSHTK